MVQTLDSGPRFKPWTLRPWAAVRVQTLDSGPRFKPWTLRTLGCGQGSNLGFRAKVQTLDPANLGLRSGFKPWIPGQGSNLGPCEPWAAVRVQTLDSGPRFKPRTLRTLGCGQGSNLGFRAKVQTLDPANLGLWSGFKPWIPGQGSSLGPCEPWAAVKVQTLDSGPRFKPWTLRTLGRGQGSNLNLGLRSGFKPWIPGQGSNLGPCEPWAAVRVQTLDSGPRFKPWTLRTLGCGQVQTLDSGPSSNLGPCEPSAAVRVQTLDSGPSFKPWTLRTNHGRSDLGFRAKVQTLDPATLGCGQGSNLGFRAKVQTLDPANLGLRSGFKPWIPGQGSNLGPCQCADRRISVQPHTHTRTHIAPWFDAYELFQTPDSGVKHLWQQ